jgi:long-subunit acyl-CoA synthetase (AMP-forming)
MSPMWWIFVLAVCAWLLFIVVVCLQPPPSFSLPVANHEEGLLMDTSSSLPRMACEPAEWWPFDLQPRVGSLSELLEAVGRRFENRPLLGTRSPFGSRPYEWVTYGATVLRVRSFAAGLRAQCPWLENGDRVGVWARNSADVLVATFGVLRAGLVVVPLYDSLSSDALRYVMDDAGLSVVLVGVENASRLDTVPALRAVVWLGQRSGVSEVAVPLTRSDGVSSMVQHSFEDVESVGETNQPADWSVWDPPSSDAASHVMYQWVRKDDVHCMC